jgi:hypothetical protein
MASMVLPGIGNPVSEASKTFLQEQKKYCYEADLIFFSVFYRCKDIKRDNNSRIKR